MKELEEPQITKSKSLIENSPAEIGTTRVDLKTKKAVVQTTQSLSEKAMQNATLLFTRDLLDYYHKGGDLTNLTVSKVYHN